MKGTDWLKARPATLVAGSPVDRNACRDAAWLFYKAITGKGGPLVLRLFGRTFRA
jgi:hypothetical protein